MRRIAYAASTAAIVAAVALAAPGSARAQRPAAGGIDPTTLKLPDGPGSVAGLNDAVSVGSFDA